MNTNKRKCQSGATKRLAKKKKELIACGLSPSQQKINFFMTGLLKESTDPESIPDNITIEGNIF
jgi:hypothetical protein